MKLHYLAFSDKGLAMAQNLAAALGGTVQRCGQSLSMKGWVEAHFASGNGLIFVGAAGIAVRAIAPYVKSKATDPAVVAVDECGTFAIPLLSGHLGGANDLARDIARASGATACVTTATDANGIFAADEWARYQNCAVLNPEQIKLVSSALLAGGEVTVKSDFPVHGSPPEGVRLTDGKSDVHLSLNPQTGLKLVPRILTLGVGCRRGIPLEALEQALSEIWDRAGLREEAICQVASVDRKADEPGLIAFCQAHHWPFVTYSAEDLREVPGSFSASSFVNQTVGVDNVCERSAVLASGGSLVCPKKAGNGVTMALACGPYECDWRWKHE